MMMAGSAASTIFIRARRRKRTSTRRFTVVGQFGFVVWSCSRRLNLLSARFVFWLIFAAIISNDAVVFVVFHMRQAARSVTVPLHLCVLLKRVPRR